MRRGSKRSSRWLGTTGLALAVALAVPGVASAAARAVATTGAASNVAQSTASLNGTVNPRGSATVYLFEYGPTTSYGGVTALTPVGSGTKAVKVTVPIGGLAPATTYHYRLFVSSPTGTRRAKGRDRTFKTMRQPLGVTLYGTPNPVRTGSSTTLAGTLTGTGNAGRQVVLQANPWPYTQGFLNVSNSLVTDASGNFAFPVLSVPVNTQFRVLMPQKPEVASPVVVVGALVRVTTHVRVTRGSRAGRVRLSGSLTPAVDGTQVLIQKFVRDAWTSIGSTNARHASGARSVYSKSLRQRRGGRYRVYVNAAGPHAPNVGLAKRVRHVRG
jgi:hypothetical protein